MVVFTPNVADFKQSAVLASVLSRFPKRFDGDIQAIPVPRESPVDLPMVQLASTDGRWRFTASPSRISSLWSHIEPDDTSTIVEAMAACMEPIENHVRSNDVQVGRVAMVTTRACEIDEPAQALIDRFCKDEVRDASLPDAPLRNSKSFEIHNHKRYVLGLELQVNSWVRCRAGISADALPIVTVEQDINSLAEELEKRTFSVNEVATFFHRAAHEIECVLAKYFPD